MSLGFVILNFVFFLSFYLSVFIGRSSHDMQVASWRLLRPKSKLDRDSTESDKSQ